MNPLRVGSIEFVNSLPVDWGLLKGLIRSRVLLTRAVPAELNRRIAEGSLDVSPVSALWYGKHHKELFLLPDLSISSESGVKSVLLFSRYELKDLAGRRIAFDGKGFTTPALLEIICRLRYGFKPEIVQARRETLTESDAWLVIGDEALIENERLAGSGVHVIDLAAEWEDWTTFPAVFAVWAVRRQVFTERPDDVIALAQDFLRSKAQGLARIGEIVDEAVRRTDLSRATVEDYFSHLSYDFDGRLKQGLELYFRCAVECGLLDERPSLEPIPGPALAT